MLTVDVIKVEKAAITNEIRARVEAAGVDVLIADHAAGDPS
jgi:hypothetical protein